MFLKETLLLGKAFLLLGKAFAHTISAPTSGPLYRNNLYFYVTEKIIYTHWGKLGEYRNVWKKKDHSSSSD